MSTPAPRFRCMHIVICNCTGGAGDVVVCVRACLLGVGLGLDWGMRPRCRWPIQLKKRCGAVWCGAGRRCKGEVGREDKRTPRAKCACVRVMVVRVRVRGAGCGWVQVRVRGVRCDRANVLVLDLAAQRSERSERGAQRARQCSAQAARQPGSQGSQRLSVSARRPCLPRVCPLDPRLAAVAKSARQPASPQPAPACSASSYLCTHCLPPATTDPGQPHPATARQCCTHGRPTPSRAPGHRRASRPDSASPGVARRPARPAADVRRDPAADPRRTLARCVELLLGSHAAGRGVREGHWRGARPECVQAVSGLRPRRPPGGGRREG